MPIDNLEDVIADSITDAELVEPTPDTTAPVEVVPEAPSEPTEPIQTTPEPTPVPEVKEVDEFDKKYGLAPQATSGRENRIPYSRVRKIAENTAKDAVAAKVKEYEVSHTPMAKFQEVEAKVKDYEGRLTQVAEFERIMTQDHGRFLQMLAGLPGYAQILAPLFNPAPSQPTEPAQVPDDMPQPDQTLTDGSKVYSMEGLKALNAWNRAQGKKEVMSEVDARVKAIEDRYAPLETDYQRHQAIQAVLPAVQKQIQDARTWPLFNESEDEITKALHDNPSYNLERAYQVVVWPKLQVNRDTMRQEILKEVKAAPRATSAPATAARPNPTSVSQGARSLEDVIAEAIRPLK